MSGFTLLWGKILESSIWIKETKETRLVWITMLAMKDSNGVIQASVIGLADRAKVTLEECKRALKVLLSEDPDDTSKVEGGRRLREVPGGWQVINHDLYRFSTEAKRAFWRETKAEQRMREEARKAKKSKKQALPGEKAYVAAEKAGASEAQLGALSEPLSGREPIAPSHPDDGIGHG